LCLYNKEIERLDKLGIRTGPWERAELRCMHEAADAALCVLLEHGLSAVPGMIGEFLRFTGRKPDAVHPERTKTAKWWAWWTSGEVYERPCRYSEDSVDATIKWLFDQCGVAVACLAKYRPESLKALLATEIPDREYKRWFGRFHPGKLYLGKREDVAVSAGA